MSDAAAAAPRLFVCDENNDENNDAIADAMIRTPGSMRKYPDRANSFQMVTLVRITAGAVTGGRKGRTSLQRIWKTLAPSSHPFRALPSDERLYVGRGRVTDLHV